MIGQRVERLQHPQLLGDRVCGSAEDVQYGPVQTVIDAVQRQRLGPAAGLADQLDDEVEHLVRVPLEDS